ncbi:Beauvericin cluster-specific repressor BEA4 [Colletotrichum spinosum]|uniref:Beauvericin cluster-specific repressor BEA4 n=1 Tax=Colletotrichum spinosum TaxID=1347390 RepID=A0A4V6QEJ1_9PEZI|nr:Beauvericin cluster-specific repressor BEA4 [Colletotrichum spinosum]
MGCRASASCFACKARKVKCDLQKPYCNRCTSLGRQCPGYADPWTVVHRQQNASAAHQVQVRVAKRLKERGDVPGPSGTGRTGTGTGTGTGDGEGGSPDSQRSDSSEEEDLVRRLSTTTVPRAVQHDSAVYSMRHFHANYTSGNEVGFFNLMFDLRPPESSPGVFEEAVKATALASSAFQLSQPGMMTQARQHYSKAITKLGAALRDSDKAKDDSVVVALLTLGLFEAINPDRTPNKISSHCRGSLALLRYRAENGIASSLDKASLAFIAQLGILEIFIGQEGRSPILTGLAQATWALAQGGVVEPLIARAIDFKYKVQDLYTQTVVDGPASDETVTELLRTGIEVIRDLEVAANYRVTRPAPRQPSGGGGGESGVNTFNGLLSRNSETSNVLAKGLYLTVRLHLIEQVMTLLIALGEPTREQSGVLAGLPHGLTALEQVCEQIRVVFGFDGRASACRAQGLGFQAWCMFWPMISVLKSCLADEGTKWWVLDKCLRVSQASGFGMAMYRMGWFNAGPNDGTVAR